MQRFSMIATEVISLMDLVAMPGDRLEVSPVQASVLMRKKLARFATKADEPPPPPEPEQITTIQYQNPDPGIDITIDTTQRTRRRRRSNIYKTRDMAAE